MLAARQIDGMGVIMRCDDCSWRGVPGDGMRVDRGGGGGQVEAKLHSWLHERR